MLFKSYTCSLQGFVIYLLVELCSQARLSRVIPKASAMALSTQRAGRLSGRVQFISRLFTSAYLVQGLAAVAAFSTHLQVAKNKIVVLSVQIASTQCG